MATSASWCSASGKTRPSKLETCRGHDHRTPSARRATRALYQQRLRRALERHPPGFTIAELSNAMDLERSFGPIYARGMVRQGRSAFAAFGVNQQQTQSSIDAALTFGILWLDACRHSADPRALLEGLKLFLPAGTSPLTRERLVHLDRGAAKWHFYEFDERHNWLAQLDYADRGNIDTRLVRCPDEASTLERFANPIQQVLGRLPECDVSVLSSAEVAFRWHGLEFARARVSDDPCLFPFRTRNRPRDRRRTARARRPQRLCLRRPDPPPPRTRGPNGARHHALFRLHPERWLESLVVRTSPPSTTTSIPPACTRRSRPSPPRTAPCSTCSPPPATAASPGSN